MCGWALDLCLYDIVGIDCPSVHVCLCLYLCGELCVVCAPAPLSPLTVTLPLPSSRRAIHPVVPDGSGRANWNVPAPDGPVWGKFSKSSRQQYVWDYKESNTKLIFLLSLLVIVSIGVCLFPVWPMWMKRGLHFILVTLLAALVIFLIIRGLIFSATWFFGYELWVLPNILSDDDDLFKPLYTFKKSKSVVWWHRGVGVAGLAVLMYFILTQPTEFERLVAAQQQFVSDLYSGSLLGDATQADRDRMRDADLDGEDGGGAPTPPDVGAPTDTVTEEVEFDHLNFEPDVPLDD